MTADWSIGPAPRDMNNPLWRYALSAWKIPDVERSCLVLQQKGWSVTRILTAAWLANQGRRFDGEASDVSQWRTQFTATLRELRKRLPKEAPALASLREKLAGAELEAERIELALVYDSLESDLAAPEGPPSRSLIRSNLQAAAPTPHIDPETEDLMETLVTSFATVSHHGAHGP